MPNKLPAVSKISSRQSANYVLRAQGDAAPTGGQALVARSLPYQRELYATAMKLTRNPDDAHDLLQETMMRVLLGWESFADDTNLRAWLYRIMTNAFINGYRKRRRHHRLTTERPMDTMTALYGDSEPVAAHPIEGACQQTLSDEVSEALASLGPQYRDVVESADLRGERYREIADRLGVPIGTVMSRLFRARRELQQKLADYAAQDWGLAAA